MQCKIEITRGIKASLVQSSSVHIAVSHDDPVKVLDFTPGHRLSSGGKDVIDDLEAQNASASFSTLMLSAPD